MAHVDYQSAFARLAVELASPSRTSWGQQQLLALLARVQAESVVDDDHHQQYLGRFQDELEAAFRTATYTPEASRPLRSVDPQDVAADGPPSLTVDRPEGHEGAPCPPLRRPPQTRRTSAPPRSSARATASVT